MPVRDEFGNQFERALQFWRDGDDPNVRAGRSDFREDLIA